MNSFFSVIVGILVTAFFLPGCTDKEAQKAKERDAIVKAIQYVEAIHSGVDHPSDLGEIFFGVSKERKATYVENLKRTPLEGCPDDFKEALQRHIEAWKDGDGNGAEIDKTGADFMTIARMHGVN